MQWQRKFNWRGNGNCLKILHFLYRRNSTADNGFIFHVWHHWCLHIYRSFATRVSQLKIWDFWVIVIERNVCRCPFNRCSVITQFAKLAAGEQLCRRCTHRKLQHFKTFKSFSWTITNFELWHCCGKWTICNGSLCTVRKGTCVSNRVLSLKQQTPEAQLALFFLWFLSPIIVGQSNHHHHISVMELDHLLTRSRLTYLEVPSKVYHDSFCQLDSSVSLPWVIYFEEFYLHVVSSFFCIPLFFTKFVLFLTPL